MVRRLGLGKNNHLTYASLALNPRYEVQSNLNGWNIFGTMEIYSRYELFEPMRVNHSARLGDKWE